MNLNMSKTVSSTWRQHDRKASAGADWASQTLSVADAAGATDGDTPSPLLSTAPARQRPTFLDWTRRVSEATMQKLGLAHGSCDENTGNLDAEIKRFKDIEDHYDETKSQLELYASGINGLIKSDTWLASAMTAGPGNLSVPPPPLPSPTVTPQPLSYGSYVRKQAGGDLVHATLLLGFEEFFFQPLRDAARNAEELRRVIKRRQGLMLDYEHHKRKAGDIGAADHKPSAEFEKAATLLKDASNNLKLQLIAFDEAYSQLLQSFSQGHAACRIFYHRASLCRLEGTSIDQGLRQVLDSTTEVLHPETGRYLSWMKSVAFVLEQNLNPKELGGCVTPFDVLLATMVEALKPKPGLFFGRPLVRQCADDTIPAIVQACTRYLDKQGMYVEGIFRVPGSIETVNVLKDRFDHGQLDTLDKPLPPPPSGSAPSEVTVHDVATLYKMWLRDLPSPLIPPSSLRTFLDFRSLPASEFAPAVQSTVRSFPAQHARTLRVVLAFLYRVNLCSEFNKMNAKNLGVCFAPSVLRSSDTEELALSDIQPGISLIQRLIETAPDVFPDLWDDYPVEEEG